MTIKEIAHLAGVSSASVSRYLNGGYLSGEKNEKIKKVIDETGYRPSVQARILRTKQASLIGVVVPKINSESISRITEGIGEILSAREYQMLLAMTNNQPEKEVEYMQLFEQYPVDGIILIGTVLTKQHKKFLRDAKVPIVVIGQRSESTSSVYHDDFGAAKRIAEIVGQRSKKKIAYIGVTRADRAAGADREDGFREGLREVGKELEREYCREAEFSMDSGFEQASDLLKKKSDIDIISCATDTIAAGAIEAILQHCPERKSEIQVTGFGDNQFLKAVTGGIPTVHLAYKTSGIKGTEMLLEMIEEKKKLPIHMQLGFELRNV